ncbi:hypothetical protein IMF23_09720 [Chelatococcus daeguensis]|uniref:hypothetical protein n=1 Tax=Chelatococcus daeguensis TaxID=444444 RepID=UPI0007AB86F9|nr:hypothetical protein [Chelatococcus daeguensis]KZE29015.1 hypothetical protein AVW15_04175 [Chelatococcus daeguensis]MBM3083708.1 hypothetical protein [Chelatococcus daeguensis]
MLRALVRGQEKAIGTVWAVLPSLQRVIALASSIAARGHRGERHRCSPAAARAALEKATFQVKLAIFVVQGLSPAEAEQASRASGEDLPAVTAAAFEGRSQQPADAPKDES